MSPNPDIPSFKNPQGPKDEGKPADAEPEKKEEKKGSGSPLFQRPGAPKAPGTVGGPSTNGGATPALKIRGLSGGPKSLFERLKQFQKKDLIFIASGLGVLFMAPLAEHFMMSPTTDQNLKPGFSSASGGMFGGEVGPHEPGTGGMAPGGLVGAGSDVITPLNVRDPSALVMAPGASQVTPPPAASTVAPPPPSASRDSGGWKDALSAAKSGAEKGADAAKPGAFKAPGNLAGALRGLSALSGGSYGGGPTFNLSAPNASNVPNRGSTGGGLSQVTNAPGYRGVGARSDSSGGNAEGMRAGAGNAGDRFNRPGGAANSLEAAAHEAIPTGTGQGGGGPSSGGENKGASGNNSKDNKALGESLAYLKMKMEMEKELDLKWSKKKWKEFEFPKMIYAELTKSAISNIVGKGLFEPLGKGMAGAWAAAGGGPSGVRCSLKGGGIIEISDDDGFFYKATGSEGNWKVYQYKADSGNMVGIAPATPQEGFQTCSPFGSGKGGSASTATDPNKGKENPDRTQRTENRAPGGRTGADQASRVTTDKLAELTAKVSENCEANGKPKASSQWSETVCKAGLELKTQYNEIIKANTATAKAQDHLTVDAWPAMKKATRSLNEVIDGLEGPVTTAYGKSAETAEAPSSYGKGLAAKKALEDVKTEIEAQTAPPPPPALNPLDAKLKAINDTQLKAAKEQYDAGTKVLPEASKLTEIKTFMADAKKGIDAGEVQAKAAGTILSGVRAKLTAIKGTPGLDATHLKNLAETAGVQVTNAENQLRPTAGTDIATKGTGATKGDLEAARLALEQRVAGVASYVCGAACADPGVIVTTGEKLAVPPNNLPDAVTATRKAGPGAQQGGAGSGLSQLAGLTVPATVVEYKTDAGKAKLALEAALKKAGGDGQPGGELKAMEDSITAARDRVKNENTGTSCIASSSCVGQPLGTSPPPRP